MSKLKKTALPIELFETMAKFENYMDREIGRSSGVNLKMARKGSGKQTLTFDEATDVAICFGYINGPSAPFDDQYTLAQFGPRRPNSLWSKRNVGKVAALTAQNRMRPSGIAAVDAAKTDGRWARAYDGIGTMTVPGDLAAALKHNAIASDFFDGLTKESRYGISFRVHTALPEKRSDVIARAVKKLELMQAPKGASSKSKASAPKTFSSRSADTPDSTSKKRKSSPVEATSRVTQQRSLRTGLRSAKTPRSMG